MTAPRWRAAVLGSPVAHSLSPVIHRAGYAALGLTDWDYGLAEVDEAGLPAFVAGLDGSWRGLSLTMPLKRACLAVADEVSDLARRIGVGNTLVRLPDGRWRADNTDVAGVVAALAPRWDPSWTAIGVLGAGATALSTVFAARELGAASVRGYARDPASAARLAARARELGLAADARPLADWPDGDEPVLVATLPPGALTADGLADAVPRAVAAPVRLRRTGPPALVFDVVYADWPTPLARAAAAAGVPVVGGLDLLVGQAARQFRLFTGLDAPVDAMLAALDERGRS